jgi:hypothetical protein
MENSAQYHFKRKVLSIVIGWINLRTEPWVYQPQGKDISSPWGLLVQQPTQKGI